MFVVAVLIFGLGAVVSAIQGVHKLIEPVRAGRADMAVGDRRTGGGYREHNRRPFHNVGNALVTGGILAYTRTTFPVFESRAWNAVATSALSKNKFDPNGI